jgi:hypothetical protein
VAVGLVGGALVSVFFGLVFSGYNFRWYDYVFGSEQDGEDGRGSDNPCEDAGHCESPDAGAPGLLQPSGGRRERGETFLGHVRASIGSRIIMRKRGLGPDTTKRFSRPDSPRPSRRAGPSLAIS